MALYYDLTNTGEEVQNRIDQVPENEQAIANEAAARDLADKSINEKIDSLSETVGTGGSVDKRIANAVDGVVGDATSSCNTLGKAEAKINSKANINDVYSKSQTYSKEELNSLITTPSQEFVSVSATQDTTSEMEVLPETGSSDTVYRVGSWDGTQYDANSYAEYAWNGITYVPLSVKQVGVDEYPVTGSQKVVEGGGISSIINVSSRGMFLDHGHMVNMPGGEVYSYVENASYDCLWIPIRRNYKGITVTGATFSNYHFFNTFSFGNNSRVEKNNTGAVPDGAVLCCINLVRTNNPDGYANIRLDIEFYVSNEAVEGGTDPISNGAVYDLLKNSSVDNNLLAQGFYINRGFLLNNYGGTWTYAENEDWDSLIIPITDSTIESVHVSGLTFTNYRFLDTADLSGILTSHYLGNNTSGHIIEGAVLCIINLLKSSNPDGYADALLTMNRDVIDKEELIGMFNGVIIQKNLINANDLLVGYIMSGGEWVYRAGGVSSNKMILSNGVTYAFQNILFYGSKNRIYLCHFDENDNLIGNNSAIAEFDEGSNVGRGIISFSTASFPTYAYSRVVLQTATSQNIDFTQCQVEVGDQYTEVVGYGEKLEFITPESSNRKKIRLLSIGNSYSQDALSYVPFILQNMGVDADIQIGILMQSSASLTMHVSNFINQSAAYTFYMYNGGSSWQNLGLKSIQNALDDYGWDLIALQQSSQGDYSWGAYQPACNQLINLVSGYAGYAVKFVWYQPQARPATVNSGANYTDAEITLHYENTAVASERIIEETVCEHIVPVGTAIQNARTIESLKQLGAYKDNPLNTSPWGYLTPNDGVHLQEGLPCQIAAYTFILALLDIYGFNEHGIIGETTRVTSEWAANKAIPGPHGEYIGSDNANCLIAQKCAVMAYKYPYQVTDMNYIIDPS